MEGWKIKFKKGMVGKKIKKKEKGRNGFKGEI